MVWLMHVKFTVTPDSRWMRHALLSCAKVTCVASDDAAAPVGLSTETTRRQNFKALPLDATPGMVFLTLSIGRQVKFDARASKF